MDEEIIPAMQIADSLLSVFSDKIDNQEPINGDILISQLNQFMNNLPVSKVKQEQINEPEIDENESEGTMIANALGKFMQNLVMNDLIGQSLTITDAIKKEKEKEESKYDNDTFEEVEEEYSNEEFEDDDSVKQVADSTSHLLEDILSVTNNLLFKKGLVQNSIPDNDTATIDNELIEKNVKISNVIVQKQNEYNTLINSVEITDAVIKDDSIKILPKPPDGTTYINPPLPPTNADMNETERNIKIQNELKKSIELSEAISKKNIKKDTEDFFKTQLEKSLNITDTILDQSKLEYPPIVSQTLIISKELLKNLFNESLTDSLQITEKLTEIQEEDIKVILPQSLEITNHLSQTVPVIDNSLTESLAISENILVPSPMIPDILSQSLEITERILNPGDDILDAVVSVIKDAQSDSLLMKSLTLSNLLVHSIDPSNVVSDSVALSNQLLIPPPDPLVQSIAISDQLLIPPSDPLVQSIAISNQLLIPPPDPLVQSIAISDQILIPPPDPLVQVLELTNKLLSPSKDILLSQFLAIIDKLLVSKSTSSSSPPSSSSSPPSSSSSPPPPSSSSSSSPSSSSSSSPIGSGNFPFANVGDEPTGVNISLNTDDGSKKMVTLSSSSGATIATTDPLLSSLNITNSLVKPKSDSLIDSLNITNSLVKPKSDSLIDSLNITNSLVKPKSDLLQNILAVIQNLVVSNSTIVNDSLHIAQNLLT